MVCRLSVVYYACMDFDISDRDLEKCNTVNELLTTVPDQLLAFTMILY